MKNSTKVKKNGFTLVEMIIALAISAFVISLIFMLFSGTSKGILFQNERAKKLQSMVLGKKKIDAAINTIHYLKSVTKTHCEGRTVADSLIIIHYKNRKLFVNNSIICTQINHFSFSQEKKCSDKTLLLWECTLNNGGWIGGGAIVDSGGK